MPIVAPAGFRRRAQNPTHFPNDPGGEKDFILFKAHSANQYRFYIKADGSYSPYAGVVASLDRNGDGTYTLKNSAQVPPRAWAVRRPGRVGWRVLAAGIAEPGGLR